jgi:phosphopantothenoylcysteine decarboxylase/phosphopantothenate--cysteine ligase
MKFLEDNFFLTKPLLHKKVLVTAGPTYEAIDPVRFIANHSSGKMGIAIAKELSRRGADVSLVLGPTSLDVSANGMRLVRVISAEEMYKACHEIFGKTDLAIMSAAVADYTPVKKAEQKIKKQENNLSLELTKTKDILKSLGKLKTNRQVLVGFALETVNEKEYAVQKLTDKNADMIVLNSLNDPGAGFGHDTNKITIFQRGGGELQFETKSKDEVAKDIVDTIINSFYA